MIPVPHTPPTTYGPPVEHVNPAPGLAHFPLATFPGQGQTLSPPVQYLGPPTPMFVPPLPPESSGQIPFPIPSGPFMDPSSIHALPVAVQH